MNLIGSRTFNQIVQALSDFATCVIYVPILFTDLETSISSKCLSALLLELCLIRNRKNYLYFFCHIGINDVLLVLRLEYRLSRGKGALEMLRFHYLSIKLSLQFSVNNFGLVAFEGGIDFYQNFVIVNSTRWQI